MNEAIEQKTSHVLAYDEIEGGFKGRPDIEFDTNVHVVADFLKRGINPVMDAYQEALGDEALKAKFSGTLGEAYPTAQNSGAALDILENDVLVLDHGSADFL